MLMCDSFLHLDFDGRKLMILRNKRKGRTAFLVNTRGASSCSECCLWEPYCKGMGHYNICWELMIKGAEHFEDKSKDD